MLEQNHNNTNEHDNQIVFDIGKWFNRFAIQWLQDHIYYFNMSDFMAFLLHKG